MGTITAIVDKPPTNFVRLTVRAVKDCSFGRKNGRCWASFRAMHPQGFKAGVRRDPIFLDVVAFAENFSESILADVTQVRKSDLVQVAGRLVVETYRRKDGSEGLSIAVHLSGKRAAIKAVAPPIEVPVTAI